MEPLAPTPVNRSLGILGGYATGIAAQMLFSALAIRLIGPVPSFASRQMLYWVGLMLVPPVLSLISLRYVQGSVKEDFARGVQWGAIIWLGISLVRLFRG